MRPQDVQGAPVLRAVLQVRPGCRGDLRAMCRREARGRIVRRCRGATLVELVMVLVITSILAGGMAVFIVEPLRGYRDVVRRARLVDEAESALRRMARDVRRALPNSVRVAAGGSALELLYVVDGARYRRLPGDNRPGPGGEHLVPDDYLSFVPTGDSKWNILGRFEALGYGPLPSGTRIAIYPTSSAVYADAASGPAPPNPPSIITPASTQISVVNNDDEDQIQLTVPHLFSYESPQHRLFVVEGPVSYLCNVGGGTLTRYSAYTIQPAQPTTSGVPPLDTASSGLLSRRVAACSFIYQAGAPQRQAVLTLELTVTEAGESVRLLHQVHVENTP